MSVADFDWWTGRPPREPIAGGSGRYKFWRRSIKYDHDCIEWIQRVARRVWAEEDEDGVVRLYIEPRDDTYWSMKEPLAYYLKLRNKYWECYDKIREWVLSGDS